MDYRAALLAADEGTRFQILAAGRLIGALGFHRGFHSGELIATVTYRDADGEVQTIFGAQDVFEDRFPNVDLQPATERHQIEARYGRDSVELRAFDDAEEASFQPWGGSN